MNRWSNPEITQFHQLPKQSTGPAGQCKRMFSGSAAKCPGSFVRLFNGSSPISEH